MNFRQYFFIIGIIIIICIALILKYNTESKSVIIESVPETTDNSSEIKTSKLPNDRIIERKEMTRIIKNYGLDDPEILKVMETVPRHAFVPEFFSNAAYDDSPLPIGHGQTISQPYIVAEMTRQLELQQDSKVLEIGTGSGYQAAVLAYITPHVYTVEIIRELSEKAGILFKKLGYSSIKSRCGDGFYGWKEEGPFDAIIVTCAAGQIPPPLLKQLKPGGRMIIPVGGRFSIQQLMLIEKDIDNNIRSKSLMSVRFVPLVRK
ncbi:MAG: protein-L-isoaspartate(D-aspartate) O-methyltransferase [Planctomycetota bacterium]|jgi:protein-L-isoaspartate(D-aspartate) O-methyltransferase